MEKVLFDMNIMPMILGLVVLLLSGVIWLISDYIKHRKYRKVSNKKYYRKLK